MTDIDVDTKTAKQLYKRMLARRKTQIRKMIDLHGLRVVCLVCGEAQRFWPADERKRLRDVECERCSARALRSFYWVMRYPELAREAATRARAMARALR